MDYEGDEMSEEYLDILLDVLYTFYTEKEIVKIYQDDIIFDSYEAVIYDERFKKKTE